MIDVPFDKPLFDKPLFVLSFGPRRASPATGYQGLAGGSEGAFCSCGVSSSSFSSNGGIPLVCRPGTGFLRPTFSSHTPKKHPELHLLWWSLGACCADTWPKAQVRAWSSGGSTVSKSNCGT